MSKLSRLHEEFIEKAQRPMTFGSLPIQAKHPQAPIVALERWREVNGALVKAYRFREGWMRDQFVVSLLSYERDVQHNAMIVIDEAEVVVKVQTKTQERVTELDKEYAKYADVLYKDVVSRPTMGSDDDELAGL
jgi:pterin-4a-carbinolamine dehydratase